MNFYLFQNLFIAYFAFKRIVVDRFRQVLFYSKPSPFNNLLTNKAKKDARRRAKEFIG